LAESIRSASNLKKTTEGNNSHHTPALLEVRGEDERRLWFLKGDRGEKLSTPPFMGKKKTGHGRKKEKVHLRFWDEEFGKNRGKRSLRGESTFPTEGKNGSREGEKRLRVQGGANLKKGRFTRS